MFAYCNDNPVKRIDPTGRAYRELSAQINYCEYEHAYGGLRENFHAEALRESNQINGTFTFGVGYVGTAGKGASVTVGIIVDFQGNIGIIQTTSVVGGIPTAGFFGFATVSNAPTIYSQQGWAGQFGGSGTVIGYEYSVFSDTNINASYHGHTFSAGFTPNTLPIEIHGGASHSILLWSYY